MEPLHSLCYWAPVKLPVVTKFFRVSEFNITGGILSRRVYDSFGNYELYGGLVFHECRQAVNHVNSL